MNCCSLMIHTTRLLLHRIASVTLVIIFRFLWRVPQPPPDLLSFSANNLEMNHTHGITVIIILAQSFLYVPLFFAGSHQPTPFSSPKVFYRFLFVLVYFFASQSFFLCKVSLRFMLCSIINLYMYIICISYSIAHTHTTLLRTQV